MLASRYIGPTLLLLLAIAGEVSAQSAVESRVEKLEEAVRALEHRVASLEERLRQRAAPTSVASDKVNWRKLQIGMPEGDVEKLLGSPARVEAFGSIALWYYAPGGQVRFSGQGRTVSGWSEP
jgi:outer membrane protein assembly factor BamE (lipoprotein component of BamABCDE complex)